MIEKYLIDDRIFKTKFLCDLGKCKGACCTLKGAGGAPILDSEVDEIRSSLDKVKPYLSAYNRKILETDGFYEGGKGDRSILNGSNEDCVFSYYENDIAKCSFQKAFNNGEIQFKKPISCHLFPIRVSGKNRNILKYEELYECHEALDKGKEKNVTMFEFLKEPVIREFGEFFFDDLKEKFLAKDKNA